MECCRGPAGADSADRERRRAAALHISRRCIIFTLRGGGAEREASAPLEMAVFEKIEHFLILSTPTQLSLSRIKYHQLKNPQEMPASF